MESNEIIILILLLVALILILRLIRIKYIPVNINKPTSHTNIGGCKGTRFGCCGDEKTACFNYNCSNCLLDATPALGTYDSPNLGNYKKKKSVKSSTIQFIDPITVGPYTKQSTHLESVRSEDYNETDKLLEFTPFIEWVTTSKNLKNNFNELHSSSTVSNPMSKDSQHLKNNFNGLHSSSTVSNPMSKDSQHLKNNFNGLHSSSAVSNPMSKDSQHLKNNFNGLHSSSTVSNPMSKDSQHLKNNFNGLHSSSAVSNPISGAPSTHDNVVTKNQSNRKEVNVSPKGFKKQPKVQKNQTVTPEQKSAALYGLHGGDCEKYKKNNISNNNYVSCIHARDKDTPFIKPYRAPTRIPLRTGGVTTPFDKNRTRIKKCRDWANFSEWPSILYISPEELTSACVKGLRQEDCHHGLKKAKTITGRMWKFYVCNQAKWNLMKPTHTNNIPKYPPDLVKMWDKSDAKYEAYQKDQAEEERAVKMHGQGWWL